MKQSLFMLSALTLGLVQTSSLHANSISANTNIYNTANVRLADAQNQDAQMAEESLDEIANELLGLNESNQAAQAQLRTTSTNLDKLAFELLLIEEKEREQQRIAEEKAAAERRQRAAEAATVARSSSASRQSSSARLNSSARPVIAARRASRAAHSRSRGLCAKYVRLALQAAGYKFTPNASAYQYATRGTLARAGFTKISNNSKPQVGDVVVISRSRKHPHGHIAIYDGRNWVSDFRQRNKSPYRESYSYTTWRDSRYLNDASAKGLYLAMND